MLFGQAAWSLKTRALTEMVYIDEVEVDQEGIAEMMLDESSIAQVARKSELNFPRGTRVLPGQEKLLTMTSHLQNSLRKSISIIYYCSESVLVKSLQNVPSSECTVMTLSFRPWDITEAS